MSVLSRRAWIAGALAGLPFSQRPARAQASPTGDLRVVDLVLDGDAALARQARLLVPTHLSRNEPQRLLVLLHGLGETNNPSLGLRAWSELYGLVASYQRLRRPPLLPTQTGSRYLTEAREAELAKELADRPFTGFACVCPVTPNPRRSGAPAQALDRYTDWITGTLLPAVRQRIRVANGPFGVGLDGCSLGGYVGIEVFLRRPDVFGAIGMVQGAVGVARVTSYAERLARALDRVGPRSIHLESSSADPFRAATEQLSARLEALEVPHVLRVPPGPHNQPWLREIGTAEMLLFHDRALLPNR